MRVKSSLFLKNQVKNIKKPFSLRMLFNLIFVISLGINVYFFTSKEELSSIAMGYDLELKEKQFAEGTRIELHPLTSINESLESELKTNIHEEESIRDFNSIEGPSSQTKQVLLDWPAQSNVSSTHTLQIVVKNSLNYTVCQEVEIGSECDVLAAHIARLLAWNLDVNSEMRNGDELNVVYERLNSQSKFKILQLIYKSNYKKNTLEANFYKESGMKYGGYFDRNGKEITKRIVKKQSPIDAYIEIVSLPGDFRKGPRDHSGTDFKADVGTLVRSTFDGRVSRVNWNRRVNGYCIEIDHPNQKIKTLYLHLSRVLVKRGQYLKQGESIGESGNTGRSFAPHLHYEVRSQSNKNIFYNPFDFKYHKIYQRKVSNQESSEFRKIISTYDTFYEHNKSKNIDRDIQSG
jgi:murein DD-endopeptidase MepM/ murein hydrolase activator NlpD